MKNSSLRNVTGYISFFCLTCVAFSYAHPPVPNARNYWLFESLFRDLWKWVHIIIFCTTLLLKKTCVTLWIKNIGIGFLGYLVFILYVEEKYFERNTARFQWHWTINLVTWDNMLLSMTNINIYFVEYLTKITEHTCVHLIYMITGRII